MVAGVQLFQGVVVLLFLLLGEVPFTPPIARRSVPKEVGESQPFVRFKRLLTSIWMITFSASGLVILGMVLTGTRDVVAQIVVIVLAGLIPMYIQRTLISRMSSPMREGENSGSRGGTPGSLALRRIGENSVPPIPTADPPADSGHVGLHRGHPSAPVVEPRDP